MKSLVIIAAAEDQSYKAASGYQRNNVKRKNPDSPVVHQTDDNSCNHRDICD
jgi:hypothetical protein